MHFFAVVSLQGEVIVHFYCRNFYFDGGSTVLIFHVSVFPPRDRVTCLAIILQLAFPYAFKLTLMVTANHEQKKPVSKVCIVCLE